MLYGTFESLLKEIDVAKRRTASLASALAICLETRKNQAGQTFEFACLLFKKRMLDVVNSAIEEFERLQSHAKASAAAQKEAHAASMLAKFTDTMERVLAEILDRNLPLYRCTSWMTPCSPVPCMSTH